MPLYRAYERFGPMVVAGGHAAYLIGVAGAFEMDVDYAMLVKIYGNAPRG
jgi:hypothetical protein